MKLHNILPALLAIFVLSSCTTKRNLTYFKDIETASLEMPVESPEVKIEPHDELIITVTSSTPEATAIYNLPFYNPATRFNYSDTNVQPRQQTYDVNADGDIIFPVLGKLHVQGLTALQLQDKIAEMIQKEVTDPIVKVEIVNFYVVIAGEVRSPRRISVNSPRYTILDAISAAGDLTPYGLRENVLVIREENGKRTYNRIDLSSADVLSSPYFFLKQNDYIYVEPSKTRQENAEYDQNNSYRLSVISTIVSGCSVVISLILAITK